MDKSSTHSIFVSLRLQPHRGLWINNDPMSFFMAEWYMQTTLNRHMEMNILNYERRRTTKYAFALTHLKNNRSLYTQNSIGSSLDIRVITITLPWLFQKR